PGHHADHPFPRRGRSGVSAATVSGLSPGLEDRQDLLELDRQNFPEPTEVTEWQLGYGDFWMFLERRYRTVAEENDWRNRSIGEMYLGKYQSLKYGQPLQHPVEKMAEVKHLVDGVRVVIPIVKQSRFVCFMSVTMRRSKG
ncbi:hypothetical protein LLG88_01555, partial [bacterium]|nr:hypothetical protein [bacterium]